MRERYYKVLRSWQRETQAWVWPVNQTQKCIIQSKVQTSWWVGERGWLGGHCHWFELCAGDISGSHLIQVSDHSQARAWLQRKGPRPGPRGHGILSWIYRNSHCDFEQVISCLCVSASSSLKWRVLLISKAMWPFFSQGKIRSTRVFKLILALSLFNA